MSVVIPSGYAQFVLNWSGPLFASGHGATVLGFGGEGDPIADADDFAGTIALAWGVNMAPETSTALTLDSIYWATATQSGVVPVNQSGTEAFDDVPPNCAVLTTYTTGFKGPRARGRSYWPGLASDTTTDDSGVIASGRIVQLEGAFAGFWNTTTASTNQVILQRDEPGQQSPPLDPPPQVNARVIQPLLATQRRRLRP